VGEAVIKNGKLVVDFKKFAIRSFAVQLQAPLEKMADPISFELPLIYDQDVVSTAKNKKNGRFDDKGISIPAELFPETLVVDGVQFNFGPKADGKNNVISCKGQKISLPKTGNFNHVYILAAALTDTSGIFKVGGLKSMVHIQAYRGNIGQFDNRTWDKLGRLTGLEKGYIKRDEVAWFATHLHHDTLAIPYKYAYVFKYKLDAGPASETLQLPENESIKIFAISLADNPSDQVHAAQPLYDDFTGRQALTLNLPISYVDTAMVAAAKIIVNTNRDLAKLPARLTMKDYADIHQPNGVTSNYYFSDADTSLTGSGTITDGMNVSAINDGMYDLLPGDSLSDKWSEKGEGRILMDLQKEIELDSIHMFTGQSTRRGGSPFHSGVQPEKRVLQ